MLESLDAFSYLKGYQDGRNAAYKEMALPINAITEEIRALRVRLQEKGYNTSFYGPQGYPTKEQQDVLPHDRPSRQGQR